MLSVFTIGAVAAARGAAKLALSDRACNYYNTGQRLAAERN